LLIVLYLFLPFSQMARKAKAKKGRRKRKLSPWIKHVMKTYRANKSAGYSAAMRRAKSTWHKKKKA
jgi:hypothetical protein